MIRKIKLGHRSIGNGEPCFIVAEAGANHEGEFDKARELIDAAVETGADSIKFQHYKADKLAAREAKRYWRVSGDEEGFQFDPDHYKEDQKSTFAKIDGLPREKDAELFRYGSEKNIIVFSTPFDFESVDHLDALGAPAFKVASGDLTYHQFLDYIARRQKPILLSTGAANLNEIKEAVNVIRLTGNDQIVLLHCTFAYPTPLEHANLLMMKHLMEEFPDLPVGFSDHTPGWAADIAAAILGASVIEKHFTHTPGPASGINKVGDSPDHDIGIGTEAFAEMVGRIREGDVRGLSTRFDLDFEDALEMIRGGDAPQVLGRYERKLVDQSVELKARLQARRSVVSNVALGKGTVITEEMVRRGHLAAKRPGTGIPPYEMDKLIGCRLNCDLPADTVLRYQHFT